MRAAAVLVEVGRKRRPVPPRGPHEGRDLLRARHLSKQAEARSSETSRPERHVVESSVPPGGGRGREGLSFCGTKEAADLDACQSRNDHLVILPVLDLQANPGSVVGELVADHVVVNLHHADGDGVPRRLRQRSRLEEPEH